MQPGVESLKPHGVHEVGVDPLLPGVEEEVLYCTGGPRESSGKDRRLLIQLNKCVSPSEQLERQAEVHSCTQDKA